LLPVPTFESRLLPDSIRGWLSDVAERMQCPLEFGAVAALVVAASLVGSRLRVRPKRVDDWTVTPNLWGGLVARPGFLKTPTLEETLKPLRAREYLARSAHQTAVEEYEFQRLYADAQRDQLKKDLQKAVKEGRDGRELSLRLPDTQSKPPVEHRYVVNDPTVEKLGELLNQNPNGLLLFRDELVGFLRSLEREGREQDRAFYLETWNGSGSYTYDRIGRGTLRIDNLTLSILGGIQPGPLSQYLRGAMRGGQGDDGLMQRFQLMVYPDTPKTWSNVDRRPDAEAGSRAHECFVRLDTLEPEALGADISLTSEGATTAFMRFGDEAQELFDGWRAGLETRLRDGSFEHAALEAHMSKYRSLMPSLALILRLLDLVGGVTTAPAVSLGAALRAAEWCKSLEAHARRIYGLALDAEVRLAKVILEHIRRGDLPPEFTARDVYRRQWSGLSKSTDVVEPLRILEDYGWLRTVSVGAGVDGGRPTVCYLTHPSLTAGRGGVE
jgi:putative DNA primase/helicase